MVGAFAVLALVLAMVGLFGILGYSVQQRLRDFGVRRALGATAGDVLRLVVWQAVRVTAIGAAAGLGLSAILGRFIQSMLFGVRPLDLWTFAFVMIVLGLTAAASIVGPVWRAVRIDPAVALRTLEAGQRAARVVLATRGGNGDNCGSPLRALSSVG